LQWLTAGVVLAGLRFRRDSTWSPLGLMVTALLWVWSDEKTLKARLVAARKIALHAWGWKRVPATSYQAFTKILLKWTPRLRDALVSLLRQRMLEELPQRFCIAGFAVFAVDGSRLELPRSVSNEQRYAAGSRGAPPGGAGRRSSGRRRRPSLQRRAQIAREKKRSNPQMWLTTLWHIGAGLPWNWRLGPSNSSERAHSQEMIESLPAEALLAADAGFVGYEGWKALLESGRHWLVRVGANVRLLKDLGWFRVQEDCVYLWPDQAAARHQPPLCLRLVVVHNGRHPVYLVTSVLDPQRLSDAQVVELYGLRWGIELFYRHFKQTFERRKLRSRDADHAELEAIWSLLGLWAMCLHAECVLAAEGVPSRRMSPAGILRAYRTPMRAYRSRPDAGEDLLTLLRSAVIDDYRRANKSSRDYPRKKQQHATGAPRIDRATKRQRQLAQDLQQKLGLRLTA
jgi:hypothetical protein